MFASNYSLYEAGHPTQLLILLAGRRRMKKASPLRPPYSNDMQVLECHINTGLAAFVPCIHTSYADLKRGLNLQTSLSFAPYFVLA